MDAQAIFRELLSRQEAIENEIREHERSIHELSEERDRLKITAATLDRILAPTENGRPASLAPVSPGLFTGMTVLQAAKQYLRAMGVPQSTRAIAQALRDGGVEVDVKDFYNKVYLSLKQDYVKPDSELLYEDNLWSLNRSRLEAARDRLRTARDQALRANELADILRGDKSKDGGSSAS